MVKVLEVCMFVQMYSSMMYVLGAHAYACTRSCSRNGVSSGQGRKQRKHTGKQERKKEEVAFHTYGAAAPPLAFPICGLDPSQIVDMQDGVRDHDARAQGRVRR